MSPRFAVIGGSNAFRFIDEKELKSHKEIDTPFGKSSPLFHFKSNVSEFLFLSRHGTRGYDISAPFVNYRANIYALKDLGVENILAWSGPGVIDGPFDVGDFVVPDDIIDETRHRDSTFYDNTGLGFIRQNPVFCPELSRTLLSVLEDLKLRHKAGGTYVCTEGPRLETPAEIRKYKLIGGNLVGMTLAPECFLAKELEMCYVPLCYITNYAEGVNPAEYREGELFEGLVSESEGMKVEQSIKKISSIIEVFSSRINNRARTCPCSRSMERYRRSGIIGDDWHTWFDDV